MNTQNIVHTEQKKLARAIRDAISAIYSGAYFEPLGKRNIKVDDAKDYIADLFEIDSHKELVFGTGKIRDVFRGPLFKAQRTGARNMKIFIEALVNRDAEVFRSRLAELISEYNEKYSATNGALNIPS